MKSHIFCDLQQKTGNKILRMARHQKCNSEDYETFRKHKTETTKIIRGVKREYERDQLIQLEEDFKRNNTRSFYQTFERNIKKFRNQNLCFRKENGDISKIL